MKTNSLGLAQRFRLSRFFVGEAPVSGPVSLGHRQIFILPTGRGLGFAVLIVLLLLIAFVYANNLAYFLAFLLASVFFVTIVHTFKSLAGLVIRTSPNRPVFVGDTALFNLSIHNPDQGSRYAIEAGFRHSAYQIVDVDAQQSKNLHLAAQTRRRGWLTADTIIIASRYPLGLFRAWSPLRFDHAVLVYPAPASQPVPFPDTAANGAYLGASQRGEDEFQGLKPYTAGDAIRQIHWKAYARGLPLQSKQYAAFGGGECWFDYADTPGGHVEERLSRLCRWLLDAEQSGVRYGLILPQTSISPDQGQAHLDICLERLALF
ncbi:MAG: DUF58 domain-containing protein [Methylomonas sp.]|nr:DUF58 domain-containing protein [Methylomonas sp.]PPD22206.1 MAG: DUF58 domain-containing protein [Methylomonas sp.]PPD27743.1 MAG: DUF58 domain-containing protein [Methylomonas sp.]PPD39754.1 MAG: DUF58 domain-containing protein [Methylomonas sp.]PPD42527.1 MAG: DUF58 domain-containing protein [Methylomonas sp.]